jgi:hypothetical protein
VLQLSTCIQKWRRWQALKKSNKENEEEYRRIEKETANKIRNAKRKLGRELVSDKDKNNRKFNKYVKSKTKSRTTIGPILIKDKKLLTDEKEMAEELDSFLSSVFTQENLQQIPEAKVKNIERRMVEIKNNRNEGAKENKKAEERRGRWTRQD